MPDLSKYPARVSRHVAMELLCVSDDETFRKVIDANPDLAHRLPGEKRGKYLLATIARLLSPAVTDRRDKDKDSRCATGTGGERSPTSKVQSRKSTLAAGGTKPTERTP